MAPARGAVPLWILLALLLLLVIGGPLPRLGQLRESLGDQALIGFALGFVALFVLPVVVLLARAAKRRYGRKE